MVISADGPVRRIAATSTVTDPAASTAAGAGSAEDALGQWAEGYAAALGVRLRPESPTVWCSWYQYFGEVTEESMAENLVAMDALGLDIDVVQIDDGYQAEIGDWLTESGRFASLPTAVARIRDRRRRAGLWVAPFLVSRGPGSTPSTRRVAARRGDGGLIQEVPGSFGGAGGLRTKRSG